MKSIFFLNNNRKDPFTIEDFEKGKLIFEDDLIWHEELSDWTLASDIQELKFLVKKRPPISKKQKLFQIFKLSFTKSLIIYLTFAVIIGIISGLLEKYQYNSFHSEIKKSFDENEIDREARFKKAKLNEERIQGIKERNLFRLEEEYRIKEEIANLSSSSLNKYEELLNEGSYYGQTSWYYELNQQMTEINEKIKELKSELSQISLREMEPVEFGQKNQLGAVSYNIPFSEIYITLKDYTHYTRWCAYVGDIDKNEDVSYNSCHKFYLRPYFAIFSVAPLSQQEQDNVFILMLNFTLASLVTNLPIFIILFLFYFKKEKKLFLQS